MKNSQAFLLFCFLIVFSSTKSQDTSVNLVSTTDHAAKGAAIPIKTSSAEALAAFTEGLTSFDVGDAKKASTQLQQAIERDPNLTAAYIFHALAQQTLTGFTSSLQQAKSHLNTASDWEKLFYTYAETQLTNDLDKRLATAKEMTAQFPDMARSYHILGLAYADRNEASQARASYQKAAELAPDWIGSYYDMAASYVNQEPKDLEQAQKQAEKAVSLATNKAQPHILLGDVHRAKSEWPKAQEHYSKAIELDPALPVAYIKRGHVHNFSGKYEEARKDYAEAGKQDTESPVTGTQYIALTYVYEGNPQKAIQMLQDEAAKLQGSTAKSRLDMQHEFLGSAALIAFHNKNEQALTAVVNQWEPVYKEMATTAGTQELQLQQQAAMQYWKGLAQVLKGDYKAASALADDMKKTLEPINSPRKLEAYHSLLGQVSFNQKDYKQAAEHFDQADKTDIYTTYWRAKAYEKAGQNDKARQLYQEVASYNFNTAGNAVVRNEVKKKV